MRRCEWTGGSLTGCLGGKTGCLEFLGEDLHTGNIPLRFQRPLNSHSLLEKTSILIGIDFINISRGLFF